MNTLRTFVVFAILSAVGYGVYATLTHEPPPPPPEVTHHEWADAPAVELPGSPSGMPPAGFAPGGMPPLGSAPGNSLPPGLGGPEPASPDGGPIALEVAPNQQSPQAMDVASAAPYAADAAGAAPPFDASASPLGAPFDAGVPAGTPLPGDPATLGSPYPGASAPADSGQYPPGAPGSADPAAYASSGNERYNTAQPFGVAPVEQPPTGPSDPAATASFDSVMSQVQAQLDQGRLADAHLELSRWYRAPQLSPQQQEQVHDLLNRLAGTVVYSQESLLEPPYEVQPGDNLERIARLYEVPWQLLAKINGIADPQQLQPGHSLKVVRGPFHASVELQTFNLTLWLGDRYAGSFPIGIGQDQSTPEGTFQVLNKLENPPYHGRDAVLGPDDPNNPLGERWIDLGNHIGIHGTTHAASIGQAESRGCIRLSERDVEDVYDILSVGSSVVIRR